MYCPVCLTGDSRVIETTKLDDMTLRYRECKKTVNTTPEEGRILFNFRKNRGRKK